MARHAEDGLIRPSKQSLIPLVNTLIIQINKLFDLFVLVIRFKTE